MKTELGAPKKPYVLREVSYINNYFNYLQSPALMMIWDPLEIV